MIFSLIFRDYSFILGKFVLLLLGLLRNRFRSEFSNHTHFTQFLRYTPAHVTIQIRSTFNKVYLKKKSLITEQKKKSDGRLIRQYSPEGILGGLLLAAGHQRAQTRPLRTLSHWGLHGWILHSLPGSLLHCLTVLRGKRVFLIPRLSLSVMFVPGVSFVPTRHCWEDAIPVFSMAFL